MDFGAFSFIAITGICYFAGIVVKASKIDDKWIPVICGALGGVLGVVAFLISTPDFPANDILNAIWVGIASGLAATGINQIYKQLKKEEK